MSRVLELAKMCLAEVGAPTDEIWEGWGVPEHIGWPLDETWQAMYTKASLLSLMKTQGPDVQVRCNTHANDPDGAVKCGYVTLAEACLNLPCHRVAT